MTPKRIYPFTAVKELNHLGGAYWALGSIVNQLYSSNHNACLWCVPSVQVTAKELSTTQGWVDIESAELAHIDMEIMFNNFIERCVSDGAKANDGKSVKSHAYPLFKAGHN